MFNNPTVVNFNSPDHNAVNPDGTQKITDYEIVAFATNDPTGTMIWAKSVPKSEVTHDAQSDLYSASLSGLTSGLHGFLFVRGKSGSNVAAWGGGKEFQSGVTPIAPSSVLSFN